MQPLAHLMRAGVVLTAVLIAATSAAKDKRKKKEPESHPTVITAITATAISIREAKAEKTIPITPSTEIYVRDQKSAVSALQPGMAVSITLAMDGDSASRISATDPPAVREKKDEKRRKKRD